jgi:Kef-type K+ transport system membrane component KefB
MDILNLRLDVRIPLVMTYDHRLLLFLLGLDMGASKINESLKKWVTIYSTEVILLVVTLCVLYSLHLNALL